MSNTHKEVTTVSKHMTVNICRHQEDINLHNDSQNLLLRNICFFKEARFNLRKVISPFSLEQRKKALVPTESIVKNLPAMQHGFNPWVRKIPLDKEMANSTPVFLPGNSHGKRTLAGYIPWGHKELDMT